MMNQEDIAKYVRDTLDENFLFISTLSHVDNVVEEIAKRWFQDQTDTWIECERLYDK